jgi:hypothetical protein
VKGLLVVIILATIAIIFLQYKRNRDSKKFLIALASFGIIVSLGVAGNLTRAVFPIYITHLVLLIFAWLGLLYYVIRNRYYWWLVLSPVFTIGLFLLLELLEGSGHEYLG